MHDDVDQLLRRTAKGDMQSFETLYRTLKDGLFGFALSYLKDDAAAADVLQETFLRMWRVSRENRPIRSGKAWIYTVARNLCLDRLRARKRQAAEPVDEAVYDAEAEETGTCLADIAVSVELRDALASLDLTSCRVVLLHLVSGFTFREIAKLLGVGHSAVEWAYYAALRRLKAYFTADITSADITSADGPSAKGADPHEA